MSLNTVSTEEARRLMTDGAVLVDIRATDEHARESIAGTRSHPVDRRSSIETAGQPVLFHCKSGNRTAGPDRTIRARLWRNSRFEMSIQAMLNRVCLLVA